MTDAKIQVDQLLGDAPDGPAKEALSEVLGFYVFASNVWNAKISESPAQYETFGSSPLVDKCAPLKRELDSFPPDANEGTETMLSPEWYRGLRISIVGIQPLWTCASDHLTEAERLIGGK